MEMASLSEVKKLLIEHERSYGKSAQRWRSLYRTLLVSSVAFSSAAALIGQFKHFAFSASADVAALLAATAAVLTTVIATLDFESNWTINRKSSNQVQVLLLEAEKPMANSTELLSGLQEIVKQRINAINKHD
jgi:hypothetical protein